MLKPDGRYEMDTTMRAQGLPPISDRNNYIVKTL